jgi:hypothetical protein
MYYMFFGLLWIMAFIIACSDFIIIVAACTWYFSHTSDTDGEAEVMLGLKWIFKYHGGSLSFGSLIIAIVMMIRIVFEFIRNRVENANDIAGNCCVSCLLCCVTCCLTCCQKFVDFINKNAYIQVVMANTSFCSSGVTAFSIIMKHAGKFGIVSGIGGIFVILGKMCIASLSTLFGFFLIEFMGEIHSKISSPYLPLMVMFLLSYIIASVFISIYSTSSLAIL